MPFDNGGVDGWFLVSFSPYITFLNVGSKYLTETTSKKGDSFGGTVSAQHCGKARWEGK